MLPLVAAFRPGLSAPDAIRGQMLLWLFNVPCLPAVTFLSGIAPLSFQPQESTRMWAVRSIVLFGSAVINTGFWFRTGAPREEPGLRVTWGRLAVAALGSGVPMGIPFHTRSQDLYGTPIAVWPPLAAGWAMRVSALPPAQPEESDKRH